MFTTFGEWYKETTRYFLYWRVPGSRLDRLFLSLAFRAWCYFFSSFHFFPLILCSSLVSAISEVFTVFSRNLSKSMQDKNTRLCAAMVGDIIFPNGVTVLWYFEALLIGIILPQFESRFKHFLLVIRIIHASRSFLQKQHQLFFSGERYSSAIINS